jgi:hypothetical protein
MKFSIRDLLWFTVVVALALGWSVDSVRRDQKAKRIQSDLYHTEYQLALHRAAVQNLKDGVDELKRRLPNSSAPAPGPPNP